MEQNNPDASAGAEDYSPDSKYDGDYGEGSMGEPSETDQSKKFHRDKPRSSGDSRRRPGVVVVGGARVAVRGAAAAGRLLNFASDRRKSTSAFRK